MACALLNDSNGPELCLSCHPELRNREVTVRSGVHGLSKPNPTSSPWEVETGKAGQQGTSETKQTNPRLMDSMDYRSINDKFKPAGLVGRRTFSSEVNHAA